MPPTAETFDLPSTVNIVWSALCAVVCNVGFQAAVAGLAVAIVIGVLGFTCLSRGKRTGKPLLSVSRKISLFCVFLAVPGGLALVSCGRLPQVNQLIINPLGLLGLWGLVTAHLCMEEMNFQWFADK